MLHKEKFPITMLISAPLTDNSVLAHKNSIFHKIKSCSKFSALIRIALHQVIQLNL